MVFVKYILLTY